MQKPLIILIVLAALVIAIMLSPRFLFQQARITRELSLTIESIPLDISWEGVKTIDYRGRWSSMYAKLELSTEKYEQVKQRFLQFAGSDTSKDFADEVLSEDSKYLYNPTRFGTMLSVMNNVKDMGGYSSMKLDEYEELIIMDTTYGKMVFFAGTSGARTYVLVKENGGNCYLYIIKR